MGSGDEGGGKRNALGDMLHKAIQDVGPREGGLKAEEVDALSQLFMMAFVPTGQENPRVLLSQMSDDFVNHVVSRLEEAKKNPIVGQIGQFFLIEWCYRNGHLNGDWMWKWEGIKRGDLHYNPRIPLSMLQLPKQV
ncbi:hypothetical protein LCGC14_2552880 [marine sediment metagenome]|uniref:Uncharacterized protein n=1 Tax=marine sediment metagenome TaxID=412755 RepID=A0A0F9DFF8_9ZZZZ